MNKNTLLKKKIVCAFMMGILALTPAACGKREPEASTTVEEGVEKTVVFTYGNNVVTKGEVYIYINSVKERYELQYGKDVWNVTIGEGIDQNVTMAGLTKQEVVEEIVRVKTLSAHAEEMGVTLGVNDTEEIEKKATDFFEGLTDDDKKRMELDEEKIRRVYEETALAREVEDKILEKRPVEVSSEEARMTRFYDMYFPCYSIDEKGNVSSYSEAQREKQYKNALQAASTLATASLNDDDDAKDVEKLAEYYKLDQAKEQVLSPNEILETYGEDIYNLLYSMENGAYSEVVESEYGYHVFVMYELTDREKTEEKKQRLKDERISEEIAETLEKWRAEIDPEFKYPDSVDMEVYDSIFNG